MRKLGYCKIVSDSFDYDSLVTIYSQVIDGRRSARRLPDIYYGCNYKLSYEGINSLMVEQIGMKEGMLPSTSARRATDNMWTGIWSEFARELSLPESCETVLSDLGIIIATDFSSDPVIERARQFYNDVLGWYVYIKSGKYDDEELLKLLVSSNMVAIRRLYEKGNNS